MGRLEAHLGVGEAQRRQPGGGVRLVAHAIACLLGGGAVVAQAVGLDHQAEVGPEEVDLEPVQALARQRQRQAGLLDQRQEAPLELGVGEAEGAPVEQRPQPPDPGCPR